MTTFALFIGINQYVDKAFTALTCPEEDASELYSLFKRDLCLGDNAHKLIGQASMAHNKRLSTVDVRRVLRDEIGPEIRNGDTFVFFFAGHGYQDPNKQDQYLLFPEADAHLIRSGTVDGELLPLSTVVGLTNKWEGVQRVFVLDACRTWLPGGRGPLPETFQNEAALAYITGRDPGLRQKPGTGDDTQKTSLAALPVIVNACSNGETAYELENKGRGVLSLALERQILKVRDTGQPIWVGRDLLTGVQKEMQDLLLAAKIGVEQNPLLVPNDASVLLFKPKQNNENKQANASEKSNQMPIPDAPKNVQNQRMEEERIAEQKRQAAKIADEMLAAIKAKEIATMAQQEAMIQQSRKKQPVEDEWKKAQIVKTMPPHANLVTKKIKEPADIDNAGFLFLVGSQYLVLGGAALFFSGLGWFILARICAALGMLSVSFFGMAFIFSTNEPFIMRRFFIRFFFAGASILIEVLFFIHIFNK